MAPSADPDSANNEEASNKQKSTYCCKLTFKWMKTKVGLLRLFQLAVLMISITVLSTTKCNHEEYTSIDAFWAVHSFVIATVATTLTAYTTDVTEKLPQILRSISTKIVLCTLAYILLVGSSAWMISEYRTSGLVVISGLSGILSGFLFVIEDMTYVVSIVRGSTGNDKGGMVYQHMIDI